VLTPASHSYRQKHAPHLFLGCFLPAPPPKLAGPLSISANAPRQLIGYMCSTAASALTARSMSVHSGDEDAWLVCLHSICVHPGYRGRGLARMLVEEYMRRLRRAENVRRGYECVALLAHDDVTPMWEKFGWRKIGVSHVQWGTGGWFEMRKKIVEDASADGKGVESKSASDSESSSAQAAAEPLPSPSSFSSGASSPAVGSAAPSSPATERGIAAAGASPTRTSPTPSATPSSAAPSAAAAPPTSANGSLPAGMTQEKLLAALKGQSSSSPPSGPRNPGTAYSSVLGQALAAKTAVEDAFHALEARLVNREKGTNIAELYCPREECGCKLMGRGMAEWEIAETGPVSLSAQRRNAVCSSSRIRTAFVADALAAQLAGAADGSAAATAAAFGTLAHPLRRAVLWRAERRGPDAHAGARLLERLVAALLRQHWLLQGRHVGAAASARGLAAARLRRRGRRRKAEKQARAPA
jgi:GNAT superfamily N-acetyltransferase